MSEVTLWDMTYETGVLDDFVQQQCDITPCPDGRFVHIDDYKSAINRLTAERDAAVADAERRLQLIRDTIANTEWRHGARNIYAELCKESREAMKEQEQGK